MVGLALVTMVSLPFLYSGQRKDEFEQEHQYSYYTGYSNFDQFYESKVIDLESSFIQEFDFEDNSYKYNLLKSINTLLEKDSISIDVLNNLYSLIDELPEEVINLIDMDNIYVSEIGTVIIDIYNEEGLFSLEVGRTKVGYFAEIDNSFVCQNDGVEFNSDNSENSPVIIKDLLEFNDLVVPV